MTHATPAAAYAHAPARHWESISGDHCTDIAAQLVENPLNQEIRVIMGGGRRQFLPITMFDPEYPDYRMRRTDGRNLIEVSGGHINRPTVNCYDIRYLKLTVKGLIYIGFNLNLYSASPLSSRGPTILALRE